MERRKSERKRVDVNVYVSLPGHAALCCKASDLSNAGVFLKTDPLSVSRRGQVDLVFALRIKSSNIIRMRHMSAVVARTDASGVGMVFCDIRNARFHRSE